MAIPPISSSVNSTAQSQTDNDWQQFTQLVSALQSGDLDTAQQAYSDFTQSAGAKVSQANPDSPFAQALGNIGSALQSGDIGGARQALQSLRPHGHGGGHHHGHGGDASQAPTPAIGAAPSDPNAPGATVNVTA